MAVAIIIPGDLDPDVLKLMGDKLEAGIALAFQNAGISASVQLTTFGDIEEVRAAYGGLTDGLGRR